MSECKAVGCERPSRAGGYCSMHYMRLWKYGRLHRIRSKTPAKARKYRNREHVVVAEAAIGKPLPDGAEIHHVDGDGFNNHPSNLVICENTKYHHLLHLRQRAIDATGVATDRMCTYCKEFDAPEKMITSNGGSCYRHRRLNRSCIK